MKINFRYDYSYRWNLVVYDNRKEKNQKMRKKNNRELCLSTRKKKEKTTNSDSKKKKDNEYWKGSTMIMNVCTAPMHILNDIFTSSWYHRETTSTFRISCIVNFLRYERVQIWLNMKMKNKKIFTMNRWRKN